MLEKDPEKRIRLEDIIGIATLQNSLYTAVEREAHDPTPPVDMDSLQRLIIRQSAPTDEFFSPELITTKNEDETMKREEEMKREIEELARENERMKRERRRKQTDSRGEEEEKKQPLSIIRNVSETVVKIPNREITIQEGNRFHNKTDKWGTIIIGNKMSRV